MIANGIVSYSSPFISLSEINLKIAHLETPPIENFKQLLAQDLTEYNMMQRF